MKIEPGSDKWTKLRKRYTEPVPGKRSALYLFAAEVLDLGDKIPMVPLAHWPLCLFIERATGIPQIDSATYRLIQCPRGLGKSSLGTHARTVQEFCIDAVQNPKDHNYSVIIFNEGSRVAQKFLNRIKTSFRSNPRLQTLFPELIPDDFSDTKWTNEEIILKRGSPRAGTPSVIAAGVGAALTGLHADKILIDDMISQDLAENAIRGNTTEIEKMERWFQRLKPLLNKQYRDPIDVIGTPWYAGDTYEYAEKYLGDVPEDVELEDAPKETFTWRVPLPDIGGTGSGETVSVDLYRRGDLAVYRRPAIVDGRSIFPEQYTKEELQKESKKPGVSQFFNAMYHLDPTSGEDTVFDEEWLMYWAGAGQMHPEYDLRTSLVFYDHQKNPRRIAVRDLTTFIAVDPAVSDKSTAAKTAIPVVGTDGQHLFLLEDFAERGMGAFDIAEQVVSFAQMYDPQKVYVETIGQQKLLMDPIRDAAERRGLHLNIEEISRHSQLNKDARIWGMERWFKRRLLYVNKRHDNFKREYVMFPRGGANRDVLDAIAFMQDGFDQAMRLGQSRPNVDAGDIQERHREAAKRAAEQLA